MNQKMNRSFLILFLLFYFFVSCVTPDEQPIPKPKSYFRIDFPEKKYIPFIDNFYYNFEIPVYSQIGKIPGSPDGHMVLVFPKYKADLIIKYLKIDTSFTYLTEKVKSDAYYHSFKADAIDEKEFTNSESNVYGVTYEITGSSACNYLFYLSDSVKNMLTGELLIKANPNYDSLKPSIDFIKSDIKHLIETLEWKE